MLASVMRVRDDDLSDIWTVLRELDFDCFATLQQLKEEIDRLRSDGVVGAEVDAVEQEITKRIRMAKPDTEKDER